MLKANLRKFLNSAVVDPRDRKNPLLLTIIEEGTPQQFELKAMEYTQEAGRLRVRMEASPNHEATTLLELYLEKLRLAATFLSLAAEKTNVGRVQSETSETTGGSADQ